MITTLVALAVICALSLAFILVIPPFASTKLFMSFLPRDVREAAKHHPDPPAGRQVVGFLITGAALAAYVGVLVFLDRDGLRRGYGFWRMYGRYLLFMYGYKVFDIVVQDQYIVIRRKYYIRFFPETRDCASWNDYSFNRRNQMIRLIAFPFLCALMAWIALLLGM